MKASAPPTERAARALAALVVDPNGLKGLTLRARIGPAREAFSAALKRLPGRTHRVPPDISDTRLFGGLNIAATLVEARPVIDPGLDAQPSRLVIPMAERISPGLAARLGQILDTARGHSMILLDEGAEAEETVPRSLQDRLAFFVDLTDVRAADANFALPAPADIDHARATLSSVLISDNSLVSLTSVAARFGIDSMRAPTLALHAARALAAIDRCAMIEDEHLQEACALVYPCRTLISPLPDESPRQQDDRDGSEEPSDPGEAATASVPDDILVQAVAALLPPGLLDVIQTRTKGSDRTGGSGAGQRRRSNRRGRPLPSHPGKPDARNRIDPVATLRVAAPWQRLRRSAVLNDERPVIIFPSDIRIRRYETHSDRLLIFLVDASGSSALARLSEAKGAVELLLAQAYAKRDQVALIAFRGETAELLLPPTRSLVQGKRRLAALPGGGGTPLAAGLQAAVSLFRQAYRHGLSPKLALLTDGRANVALDGRADRQAAFADAQTMSRHIRAEGIDSILIDTSIRPGAQTEILSRELDARYIELPRADAGKISIAIDSALDG